MQSVELGVRSVKCGVRSLECKCKVWGLEVEVQSGRCKV